MWASEDILQHWLTGNFVADDWCRSRVVDPGSPPHPNGWTCTDARPLLSRLAPPTVFSASFSHGVSPLPSLARSKIANGARRWSQACALRAHLARVVKMLLITIHVGIEMHCPLVAIHVRVKLHLVFSRRGVHDPAEHLCFATVQSRWSMTHACAWFGQRSILRRIKIWNASSWQARHALRARPHDHRTLAIGSFRSHFIAFDILIVPTQFLLPHSEFARRRSHSSTRRTADVLVTTTKSDCGGARLKCVVVATRRWWSCIIRAAT
mmetsp:Transcript_56512/g.89551  ORF Transcript_56512/g.89551 Transcript_56512/m.89551 type:complete len:266 (-) Transcript_56512:159-956(-)